MIASISCWFKTAGSTGEETTKDDWMAQVGPQGKKKEKEIKRWKTVIFHWNLAEASTELAVDATPPPPVWTCVLCLDKFRKSFPTHSNMAQAWKWKERRIAWCADKGEPSERLATHHTAAAADPERREALISPDSTRWNSAAQSGRCLYAWVGMCVCVSQAQQQRQQRCCRCRRPPCFEFATVVPGREAWLMGPSYGKQSGVLKERREVRLKQILIFFNEKLMACNLCAVYVHLQSLTSIWSVLGRASLCIPISVTSPIQLCLMDLFHISIRKRAHRKYLEKGERCFEGYWTSHLESTSEIFLLPTECLGSSTRFPNGAGSETESAIQFYTSASCLSLSWSTKL